jgi:hypothetical protein
VELRSLLDWTVTQTSLEWYDWLKVADMTRSLESAQINRLYDATGRRESVDERGRVVRSVKLTCGGLLFLLLVLVVWFPLFFFSSANFSLVPNRVVEVEVRAGFEGWQPLYAYDTTDAPLLSPDARRQARTTYPSLSSSVLSTAQQIRARVWSDTRWTLTPPSRAALESRLADKEDTLSFYLSLDLARDQAAFAAATFRSRPILLDEKTRHTLAAGFAGNGTGATATARVDDCYPAVLRLPCLATSTPALVPSSIGQRAPCFLAVVTDDQPSRTADPEPDRWLQVSADANHTRGLTILLLPDEAPEGFAASLATAGLIGVYLTFVLSIGRFLRVYVSGIARDIPFEDMRNPQRLLALIADLATAREAGAFGLERGLYKVLLELYLSQEQLRKFTEKKEHGD